MGFRPGATKENPASRLYVVSLGLGWWEVYECRVLRFVGLVFAGKVGLRSFVVCIRFVGRVLLSLDVCMTL